jgi:hypothetical protein
MKLALFAASLSLVACDLAASSSADPARSTNAAITALEDLGPERHLVPVSAPQAHSALELVHTSTETTSVLERLTHEGFDFSATATTFWLVGDAGARLTTVVHRGVRDGEVTLVATVLAHERVLGALEVEGEGEVFAVYGEGFSYVAKGPVGPASNPLGPECLLSRDHLDPEGALEERMCLSEANFLCFWQHQGERAAFAQCVARRAAGCSEAPSCD